MKRCPECRRDYYDDTLLYCLDDGSALLEGPASAGEDSTVLLHDARRADEQATRSFDNGPDDRTSFDDGTSRNGGLRMPWTRTTRALAASIAVLMIGGVGYALYWSFSKPPSTSNRPTANSKIQRLTGDGKTSAAAISWDGKFLANVRDEGGFSLWVKQISTNSNVKIVDPGVFNEIHLPTFTPDGSFVFFWAKKAEESKGTIFRVPTLGGPVAKVLPEAGGFSFSPDGKQLVFERFEMKNREHSLFILNVDGTGERKLSSRFDDQWYADPAWSPDGKLIAVGGYDGRSTGHKYSMLLVNVSDGSTRELTQAKWDAIYRTSWLPDMSGLIFEGTETNSGEGNDQLWQISYPSGEAHRVSQNVNDYNGVSITGDGKTLVTVEREYNDSVWVSPNADINDVRQVTSGKGFYSRGIAWTPDGRIVYVSTTSGVEEVWIMNADGTGAKQLTNDGRVKFTPVVSPDSRYVVYAGTISSETHIFRVDIAGGNPVQLTQDSPIEANPEISTDGKWVIYSSFAGGVEYLRRVPIDGGAAQPFSDLKNATEPRASRDGKYIACFYWDDNHVMHLAILPAEGGSPVKTFDLAPTVQRDPSPVWTADGRGITYIDYRNGVSNLWMQPLVGGPPQQITDYKQDGITRREWTRDGRKAAIVRSQAVSDAVMVTDFR